MAMMVWKGNFIINWNTNDKTKECPIETITEKSKNKSMNVGCTKHQICFFYNVMMPNHDCTIIKQMLRYTERHIRV